MNEGKEAVFAGVHGAVSDSIDHQKRLMQVKHEGPLKKRDSEKESEGEVKEEAEALVNVEQSNDSRGSSREDG